MPFHDDFESRFKRHQRGVFIAIFVALLVKAALVGALIWGGVVLIRHFTG